MLLERCQPGTPLRKLPEAEQDIVISRLFRRLWRSPSALHRFLDRRPVRLWTFARAAAQADADPNNTHWLELARAIAI